MKKQFIVTAVTRHWETNEPVRSIQQIAPVIMGGLLEGPFTIIMNEKNKEDAHE